MSARAALQKVMMFNRNSISMGVSVLAFSLSGCSADPSTSGGSGGKTGSGGSNSNGGAAQSNGGTGNGNGGATASNGGSNSGQGGVSSGGSSNGGSSNGGSSNGGSSNGGGNNGGSSNGGGNSGGSSNGGSSNGGSGNGGSSNGGGNNGGSSNGGSTDKGGASSGGATSTSGGASSGGKSSGGASSGGSGSGGTASTGNEFWISPTGNDSNPGTKAQPLFSLCDDDLKKGACYKVCPLNGTCLSGGATIWVMDGTYKYGSVVQKIGSTKLGTASGTYKVWAEAGAKPVFDFTGQPVADTSRGIQLQGDYWHIKGITVTKAGDTGIFVMGNNNTVEQCVTHHNQDAGLVIGVNSNRSGSGVNNLILNCDSYQNYDSATKGENADGFGMKENVGGGNVFRGCRAWDNGDDGWDLYAWSSPVTIDNCWAINQTSTIYGAESDGNGFKLGGDGVSAAHKLSNLYAVGNGSHGSSGRGFTNNSNPASMSCSGTCGSWSNKAADQGVSGITRTSGPTAAQMANAQRQANGDLPSIDSL